MQLTEAERLKILTEFQRLGSKRGVAKALGISVNTVTMWLTRFSQHGTVRNMKQSGRPRLMSTPARAEAVKRLLGSEGPTTQAVATALHADGFTGSVVSRSTLVRAAKLHARSNGKLIHCVRGLPKKSLTHDTKTKRMAWAQKYRKLNWAHVMFTDRKRFEFKYPGMKATTHKWVEKGTRHEMYKVNHGMGLNLYAGVTRYGLTAAHIVTGTSAHKTKYKNQKGMAARNITTREYCDVMTTTLLPEGKRLFSCNGISSWTFQQDNDPTHKLAPAHVAAWNARNASAVKVMEWPPNSPDLSPIENIWAYVDAKVQGAGCKTFIEFKEAVLRELRSVPKGMIAKLYGSMRQRVEAVVSLDGGKTKY
jgi:transposase